MTWRAAVIVEPDVDILRIQHFRELVADELVDRLHVEARRKTFLHAVDDRQFRGPLLLGLEQALRLVEQPRVLQRDAHRRRDRLQQADVRLAEIILALEAFDGNVSYHHVAGNDRDLRDRLGLFGARHQQHTELARDFGRAAEDRLLVGAQLAEHRRRRQRRHGQAPAMLEFVEVVDQVGLPIEQADSDVVGAEDVAELVADEVDDRLQVELRREPLLDAVDDLQFGGALLLGLEQPLRLVEQAGVVERDAHRVAQRRQQAHVGFGKGVCRLLADADEAGHLVVTQNRNVDEGIVLGRPAHVARFQFRHAPVQFLGRMNDERFARGENVGAESCRRFRGQDEALAVIDRKNSVKQIRGLIVETNPDNIGVENLANLVADEIVDRLHFELRREPFLHAVDDRELRGALQELGVGCGKRRRALLDLALQPLRPLRVVERDRRLVGEHSHHVAVGVVEAAVDAVHVDVEVAQQRALRDERRDDPRALLQRGRLLWRVDELRTPRQPSLFEQRLDLDAGTAARSRRAASATPRARAVRRVRERAIPARRRSIPSLPRRGTHAGRQPTAAR